MIPSFLRFYILRSCCFARCFPAAGEVPPTAPRAAYEKRATEIHPLLLCNSPPATQVVSQSIALIGSGVNCFLPHCGPFCMPAIRYWRWGRRSPGPLPGQQEPRFQRKRRHFQRPAARSLARAAASSCRFLVRRLIRQTEQMPSTESGAMGLPQSAQRVLVHL